MLPEQETGSPKARSDKPHTFLSLGIRPYKIDLLYKLLPPLKYVILLGRCGAKRLAVIASVLMLNGKAVVPEERI
jgi:hypothetical protein